MRQIATFAAVVLSVLAAEVYPSSAQSPYDYPWCSRQLGFGGPTSCYFASYQQCLTTVRGIGGYCYQIQLTGVQLGAVVNTPASATTIGHQHRAAAGAPWEIGTAADGAVPEDHPNRSGSLRF
jgi:hypothetical protein